VVVVTAVLFIHCSLLWAIFKPLTSIHSIRECVYTPDTSATEVLEYVLLHLAVTTIVSIFL
jgi:hypothetical protein